MFFRNPEKHSVLNLDADAAPAGELTAGIIVSSQPNLSTEDKVKQYFEQLREPIFRYLTSTFGGEHSQAEEITHDVFLQLYRSLSSGQTILNVRAWSFRVAHNMAVTQLKRQQFIAPLSEEEWDDLQRTLEGKDVNPEQILLQKEKLSRLRKAISRLTLVERQCLNLRTKGFRYREIGEILDISTRSVSNTLYRVIDKLAKESNG
jgi:RNA polymerase sigma-70 factor (ECF subfamily)